MYCTNCFGSNKQWAEVVCDVFKGRYLFGGCMLSSTFSHCASLWGRISWKVWKTEESWRQINCTISNVFVTKRASALSLGCESCCSGKQKERRFESSELIPFGWLPFYMLHGKSLLILKCAFILLKNKKHISLCKILFGHLCFTLWGNFAVSKRSALNLHSFMHIEGCVTFEPHIVLYRSVSNACCIRGSLGKEIRLHFGSYVT